VGNALVAACAALKRDLQGKGLAELAGRVYEGAWRCDWTTAPRADGAPSGGGPVVTHYSYGYAAQLAILDGRGDVAAVVAAHDAGRIVNPTLFEGQIQGAVVMGLGYALSEDLPLRDGIPDARLADLGLPRAADVPRIEVIGVVQSSTATCLLLASFAGNGLVPTAAAVANALCLRDGRRRFRLPLRRKEKHP